MTNNRKIALVCLTLASAMLVLAYASVPLYTLFCQVTGYGGTPQQKILHVQKDTVNTTPITVRFDANVSKNLPWTFTPPPPVTMKPGKLYDVSYTAQNTSAKATTGTATFNVTPHEAGFYLVKIECFCFQKQILQPGEKTDMKVSFYVDPSIAEDTFRNLTLSYTFFPHAPKPL